MESQSIKSFVHSYHDEVSVQKGINRVLITTELGVFLKREKTFLTMINSTLQCNTEKIMHIKIYVLTELSAFKPDPPVLDDAP